MTRHGFGGTLLTTALVASIVTLSVPGAHADQGVTRDLAFGTDGRVVLHSKSITFGPSEVVAQTDGKTLVLAENDASQSIIRRFTEQGELDLTFASAGQLSLPNNYSPRAWSLPSTAGDGILVVQSTLTEGTFTVSKFDADGAPETGFGGDGDVAVTFTGGASWQFLRVIELESGHIVMAASGMAISAFHQIIRLDSSGSLDSDFGLAGRASFAGLPHQRLVGADGDGRLYLASTEFSDPTLVRLTSSGEIDTTYGVDGFFSWTAGLTPSIWHVAPDGSVDMAWPTPGSSTEGIHLRRITPSGQSDLSFANGGAASAAFQGLHPGLWSTGGATPLSIHRLEAGRVAVIARTAGLAAVAVLTSTGELDATFGEAGRAIVSLDIDVISGDVTPDGTIFVVGDLQFGNQGLALQRSSDSAPWPSSMSAPSDLTVDLSVSDGLLKVSGSWGAVSTGDIDVPVTHYHYRLVMVPTGEVAHSFDTAALSGGLVNPSSGDYTFMVRAVTRFGEGPWASSPITVPTWPGTIQPPTHIDLAVTYNDLQPTVHATWPAPASGQLSPITGYTYRVVDSIDGSTMTESQTTATEASLASPPGGTYRFEVRANSVFGSSAWKSAVLDIPKWNHNFVATVPARVFDTRPGSQTVDHLFQAVGVRPAGSTTSVKIAGRAEIDPAAIAVSLHLTVQSPAGPGFITAFPCTASAPTASSLNFARGMTTGNSAIVPLDPNGNACFHTPTSTHLIVDVAGYFLSDASFVPLSPARLLDTRDDSTTIDGLWAGLGAPAANTHIRVKVAGRGSVPLDARLVALNVTVTQAERAGWGVAYACDAELPHAASINYAAGATIANHVIAPLDAEGFLCWHTSAGASVIIDVAGAFIDSNDPSPSRPSRLLDTRPGQPTIDGAFSGIGARIAGSTTVLAVAGRADLSDQPHSVIVNIVVTHPVAGGYITAFPCNAARPTTSSLNFVAGQTVANASIVQVDYSGTICLFTSTTTQLIVDVGGTFESNGSF